jgi:phosphate-selective porin OprO and OprP
MFTQRRSAILIAAGAAMLAAAGPLHAQPAAGAAGASEAQAPPFTLRTGARVQVRYVHDLPGEGDAAGTFLVRRARLSVGGDVYEHFRYAVQVELAGAAARVLDANVTWAAHPLASVWFGQGKAPYGRQQLTPSGNLQLVDRTIVDGRFSPGRQVGVAVNGRSGVVEYGAGVYNGDGINVANQNDRFLYVGRVVLTPLGAFAPQESAHDRPGTPRLALGGAVMHSTLGIAEAGVDVLRYNAEAAFKLGGFSAVGEFHRENASPPVGTRAHTNGWYAQAGFLLPGRRHEIAGRYGMIHPDAPNADVTEAVVGYSHYVAGHRAKLQTDLVGLRSAATGHTERQVRVQFQLTM